jgi:wobble nucleotide-excising tRNase
MITRLQFLRSIGQFDAATGGGPIPLARTTVVYAENGRGKTTLTAVLRSLATNDPIPIAERRRLAAANTPNAVIELAGGPPPAVFDNNAWSRTLPDLTIFDDVFVDRNVYSGLAVEPAHRQGLHELILGARGIALNQQLQNAIALVAAHTNTIRNDAAAIPAVARGPISVDDFCALQPRADIGAEIQAAERALAAAQERAAIQRAHPFDALVPPAFDVAGLTQVLALGLAALDREAAARVQAHLAQLGQGGEAWVADGVRRVPQEPAAPGPCPFCAQDLAGSPLLAHYRAYFSNAYSVLKRTVADTLTGIGTVHGGDAQPAFERAVRVAIERRQFWARFCDVPEINLDTAAITGQWRAAHAAVTATLTIKQGAPLDPMTFSNGTLATIATYEASRAAVNALNQQLGDANGRITAVKAQAAVGDEAALATALAALLAVRWRYEQGVALLCTVYLASKAAKVQAELQRDAARAALDAYRAGVFAASQAAINVYLERFNAGFRLDSVASANTAAGSVCNYNVLINATRVPVAGGAPAPGTPTFRNTLSAGDRTTLALSFFLVSLDQDQGLANKVVVIDDPISSLDEHRALTTVQEIRRLVDRTAQVIVLSHNKPFLCDVWEGADTAARAALEVGRVGLSSDLRSWNVDADCVTQHDRRHEMLRNYVANGGPNNRDVAAAIRPTIEAFLRVSFPETFRPGTMLGPFRNVCQQRVGTAGELLDAADIQELNDLTAYANQFHHDTNPGGFQTVAINDGALTGFLKRALRFAKR